MKHLIYTVVLGSLALTAHAQVLPFNEAGVTMGHHHIMTSDIDSQRAIWGDVLGGKVSGNAPLEQVKFPGALIFLTSVDNAGGTRGSALDHIAFNVRELESLRSRLVMAGVEGFNSSDARFDAILPGGIEVHFFADPDLAVPIEHRAMALVSTDAAAQRSWWANVLGAETHQEGEMTVSTIPGARLFFTESDTAPAPTRGRVLDHTGIGVADVAAFCKQVAAKGVECEMLFNGAAAIITDPGGVAIEVNAGLENR